MRGRRVGWAPSSGPTPRRGSTDRRGGLDRRAEGARRWDRAGRIEREAPERLETPAGTRRRLSYEGESVFLEARIQEVFGLSDTPRVAGVPVTLRLLSPAERPLQVTGDLASFWRNTYPEVRKEMRGRYPRHYWPEDPLVAEPTSRPKPRGT
jgi:ATP-dependent helicase HrpB